MAGYIGSKASVVSNGAERKKVFDITTTTTSLTGCSYTPNQVHVFHNGVRLVDGTDYTATDGSTVTLTTAAQSGDEVVVVSYATFQTSDTVSASAGGTFSNAVTIDANGATVLTVDRATSDGTIIDLQKDGSSVGSVGALSNRMYVGTADTGVYFESIRNAVTPFSPTENTSVDNNIDLGWSLFRYKDRYLSGGVYLGGTGAANYLDDYEEGTWLPTLSGGAGAPTVTYSLQTGRYTKVGNKVTLWFIVNPATCSGGTGTAIIQGLPFAPSSSALYSQHPVLVDNLAADRKQVTLQIEPSNNFIPLIGGGGSTGAHFGVPITDFNGGETIRGTVTYEV